MVDNYKYDVAFSFLQEDEQLALDIADRIQDRVSVNVFVYSERQDELAGTDGVDTFSRIFGEESRVVIVLHHKAWGQTRWTRVEENAIRMRGFNEGHEFVLLVELETPAKPPVWLPPTRIYLGFERYGVDGVATVIESRVQAVGGTVHSESAVDEAVRLGRELSFKSERIGWYESEQGVASAKQELKKLFGELQRVAKNISDKTNQIQVQVSHVDEKHCLLSCQTVELSVYWHNRYQSTLHDSQLGINLAITRNEGYRKVLKEVVKESNYNIDVDMSRHFGWRETSGKKRFLTSVQLADSWIKVLLDQFRDNSGDSVGIFV